MADSQDQTGTQQDQTGTQQDPMLAAVLRRTQARNAAAASSAPVSEPSSAPASVGDDAMLKAVQTRQQTDPFAQFGGKSHIDTNNMIAPQPTTAEQLKRDPGMPLRNKIREIENYTQEGRQVHPILAKVGDYLKNVYVPSGEVPQDMEHPLAQPVPPPLPGLSAAVGGAAAESTTARAAVPQPGLITQIAKGKQAAAPQAEEALRKAVSASSSSAGASTVAPQSLRTALEDPINAIEADAKRNYQAMDEVTGGKFQPNVDALKNVNNKLQAIAGLDDAEEARLQATKTRLEWQQEKLFDEAGKAGVPKEVVSNAKAQFRQAQAMRDLEVKVFKNPSSLAGNIAAGSNEFVNVDNTVKALQKLADNKEWGSSRLEQAVGSPEAAKQLLNDMYAAQRLGAKFVSRQQLAAQIGKYVGAPIAAATAGTVAYEALK